jgi:hypothetical protein
MLFDRIPSNGFPNPATAATGHPKLKPPFRTLGLMAFCLALSACSSTASEAFYVGRFDPLTQLPQELYRFRVNGEGSWYHDMKFASGWLPASVVDPLGSTISIGKDGVSTKSANTGNGAQAAADTKGYVEAYRTMRLFGPEAFLEVPKDLRFCVVMSADPNKFFQAARMLAGASMDDGTNALGVITKYQTKATDEYTLLDQKLSEVQK